MLNFVFPGWLSQFHTCAAVPEHQPHLCLWNVRLQSTLHLHRKAFKLLVCLTLWQCYSPFSDCSINLIQKSLNFPFCVFVEMVHLAFTSVAAWLFLLVFPEHWHINNEPQAWWRERSMPLWPLSTQYGSRCRWGNDATAWLDYYNSILVSPSDPCPVPVPVIPVPVIDNWDRDRTGMIGTCPVSGWWKMQDCTAAGFIGEFTAWSTYDEFKHEQFWS